MTNLQIAKLLRSVAAALSLASEDNKFRITAYERAADAVEHASSEVKDLWDDGKLKDLAGVGVAMAGHLDELFRVGRVKHFESILKEFPEGMFELLEIPGIGPKTGLKLCQEYGITRAHSAINKLEKVAKKHHLDKILQGIKELKGRTRRMLLHVAQITADSVIEWLKIIPQVKEANTLGSLRRQTSTVGDVDISVASNDPQAVIAHFVKYPHKSRVIEAGDRTASLLLPNEYQVDLMVQSPAAYGALLQHFTGSKHHNIALREYALKKGFSLSEYGIKVNDKLRQFPDEKSFYNFLGLDWIPPELREDTGEIGLSAERKLPHLVELSDIKGDLQIHSNIDIEPSHDIGTSSINQIAQQAKSLGYEYVGLTDHNPSVSNHTEKQIIDLIQMRTKVIHSKKRVIHVFNGLEIDIQSDGRRALPDVALELLDYACVSIHSSFRLSRKAMTDRVLSAFDHPKVKFFAHPTGRLLQEREGVELDWDQIFDFCVKNHKWLEIDGWPNRLDLPDVQVREAIKYGVKIVIDTDSHAANQLELMRYGISVARRGWATKSDIINTANLTDMKKLLGGER